MCRSQSDGGRRCPGGKGTRYTGEVRYRVTVTPDGGGSVSAYQDYEIYGPVTGTREVGTLVWDRTGKLHHVGVVPGRQRIGIGTALWQQAQQAAGGAIRHSEDRTDAGENFARSVGGTIPSRSDWRGDGEVAAAAGHAGDEGQRESYEGTPWQGYDEYMQRSEELERRIAAGESVTDIMREEHVKRMEERIAQITQEGW